tara:strand:- start:1360 stop:2490 length:1131 start_codon:yes stop_codon:yes gene_type:complete
MASHSGSAPTAEELKRNTVCFPSQFNLYVISDLHTNVLANRKWIENLHGNKAIDKNTSGIIVAGDVSESFEVLRWTLQELKNVFDEVFYVPGNHCLWLTAKGHNSREDTKSSISKYKNIIEMCDEIGVRTRPTRILRDVNPSEHTTNTPIWIVPLLSWYHEEFDTEKDIPEEVANIPPAHAMMTDFSMCVWPKNLDPKKDDVAKYFDELNDSNDRISLEYIKQSKGKIITYSHFLPRIELIPEKRFLFFPNLSKAVGSIYLQQRVKDMKPILHVFGHTHFGWDTILEDGIRYVQMALANPRERQQRMKSLYVGTDPSMIEEPSIPLLVLTTYWKEDDEEDVLIPQYWASWSEHYKKEKRSPENTELAPWVKPIWTK